MYQNGQNCQISFRPRVHHSELPPCLVELGARISGYGWYVIYYLDLTDAFKLATKGIDMSWLVHKWVVIGGSKGAVGI